MVSTGPICYMLDRSDIGIDGFLDILYVLRDRMEMLPYKLPELLKRFGEQTTCPIVVIEHYINNIYDFVDPLERDHELRVRIENYLHSLCLRLINST